MIFHSYLSLPKGMFHIFPRKSTVGFPRKSQVQGSDAAARAARAQRFGAHGMAVRFEKSGIWIRLYPRNHIYNIYIYICKYIYVVLTYVNIYICCFNICKYIYMLF